MIDVALVEIDWNGLHSAFQMNMPEVRCFLCLDDGNVVKLPPGDQRLADVRAETARYSAIEAVPSRIQYQWLDEYIKTIEDDTLRGRMEAAINGKGAQVSPRYGLTPTEVVAFLDFDVLKIGEQRRVNADVRVLQNEAGLGDAPDGTLHVRIRRIDNDENRAVGVGDGV